MSEKKPTIQCCFCGAVVKESLDEPIQVGIRYKCSLSLEYWAHVNCCKEALQDHLNVPFITDIWKIRKENERFRPSAE